MRAEARRRPMPAAVPAPVTVSVAALDSVAALPRVPTAFSVFRAMHWRSDGAAWSRV